MMKKTDTLQDSVDEGRSSVPDKTFMTMPKNTDSNPPYTLHDLLFPAGKVAKLCKIVEPTNPGLRFREALNRFGFQQPTPVILLAGAIDSNRSKFYAGICRAAFRTDAVVIDSGVKSGIEQFALRRKVKVVGVFPESEVLLPKVNPVEREWNELSNGHTHLFMLCETSGKEYRWNDEGEIKMKIAKQIAEGTVKTKAPKCKIVTLVMGDLERCSNDIIQSIENNLPVILVGGSQFSDNIIKFVKKEEHVELSPELAEAMTKKTAHIYCLEDNNSEEIASFLHFFLTVTPY